MKASWSELLIDLPVAWDFLLRVTIVLAVVWSVHVLLAGCNPRWRVQLWRFTALSLIAVSIGSFLPRIAIAVGTVRDDFAADVVSMTRPFGAGELPTSIDPHEVFFYDVPYSPVASTAAISGSAPELTAEATARNSSMTMTSWMDHWELILAIGWGVGVIGLAACWLISQIRIYRLIGRTAPAAEDCRQILNDVAGRLSFRRNIDLRVSSETDVPFVAGMRCPVVVLPARMADVKSYGELPAIFAHELAHIQSRDLAWMGIAQWIAIPLWFHPLIWRVRSAHAMACEEVADAVAADTVGDVAGYSRTLARVALEAISYPPTATALSMARTPEIVSRLARLKRGLSDSPLARRRLLLATAFAVLMLMPLATVKLAQAEPNASNDQATPRIDRSEGSFAPGRTLNFPTDRSVGQLWIATPPEPDSISGYGYQFSYHAEPEWTPWGNARGKVTVPAGSIVKFVLKKDGADDMSWTAELQPDDLYEFFVYQSPGVLDAFRFGDAQVRHLARLTGLTNLELMYVDVTAKGIERLESMRSLKKLRVYSPTLGNDGLKSIGRLTSLELLTIARMKWDDAGLIHLGNLQSLEELSLPHPGRPGPGFDTILSLPRLRLLSGTQMTDAHLARLDQSQSLTALRLDHCTGVTDSGLRHLVKVPQLEYLSLYKTNITDAGVENLAGLTSLKRLNLQVNRFLPGGREPALTMASARTLSELKTLESLQMTQVSGGDEALKHISALPNLRDLAIGGFLRKGPGGKWTKGFITADGVRHLEKLTNLERLHLFSVNMTDAGMNSLAQLNNLQYLHLGDNSVTDDGIARLRELKKLRDLTLSCNKRGRMTFAGVSRLNGLPELRRLWYSGRAPRPDAAALDLSNLPGLEDFCMGHLRDQDLAGLASCHKMKRLQIGFDSSVTDEGLAYLAGMKSMEVLLVSGQGITDAGLVHLDKMGSLWSLAIHGSLTDQGLRQIEEMKSLGSVTINSRMKIGSSAVARLRRSLPNLYSFSVNQDRAPAGAKPDALKVGQVAPAFRVKTIEGEWITLGDYRGKILLLYFWSTSCGPCVASMPHTRESYEQLSKYGDFEMVSLSGDDNDSTLRGFVKEHELTWPQVRIGHDSKLADAYGVSGYPKYILVGKDGRILCTKKAQLNSTLIKALDIKDAGSN